MGYVNPIYDITTAWYSLLNGVLSVPVYKTDVPAGITTNHVIVRGEQTTATDKNKHLFNSTVTVIVEIVTIFGNVIDESVAAAIDAEINGLILPDTQSNGLTTDYSIYELNLQTSSQLVEDDGTNKYFTKINRYEHFLNQ